MGAPTRLDALPHHRLGMKVLLQGREKKPRGPCIRAESIGLAGESVQEPPFFSGREIGSGAFLSGEHMRPACGSQRPAATIFCVPNRQRRTREQAWPHGAKFAEAGRLSPHSRRVRSPEIAILTFRVRDQSDGRVVN